MLSHIIHLVFAYLIVVPDRGFGREWGKCPGVSLEAFLVPGEFLVVQIALVHRVVRGELEPCSSPTAQMQDLF